MTRVAPWPGSGSGSGDDPSALMEALVAEGTRTLAQPSGTSWTNRGQAADREPVSSWSRKFVRQLLATDAVCATIAIAVGWAVRFGFPNDSYAWGYALWSGIITLAWIACLQSVGAYEVRRISTGAREYQRVLRGTVNLAGAVGITGYLTGILLARTFVAIVIPTGALLMLAARYFGRLQVHRRRARGEWTSTILAVGTSESVRHLAEVTARNPYAGLVVVGACVEDRATGDEIYRGVPVMGDVNHASDIAEDLNVDIVAVAGSGLGPRRIRELGWALEGTGRNMVMAPGLTEVAGPRVHVSPVEGLPLMWVDQPQFSGGRRFVKRAVDIFGAGALLLIGAPFLLLTALVVRLTSRGPSLYASTRLGEHGREFTVYKFRSMYQDADRRRADLLEFNESDGGVLFKIRDDPRVTKVGRLLRKLSIDELPQLLNVLKGNMSLVGPRPPLPEEVDQYQHDVRRRLLVKPGMTGLWQVSGRSDLTWDESVRLDLYYVENWSLGLDLTIIARTIWVVMRSRGAY